MIYEDSVLQSGGDWACDSFKREVFLCPGLMSNMSREHEKGFCISPS